MNEAVEIVANALLRADSAAASYHDLARAAIGALREPTAAMIAAYNDRVEYLIFAESLTAEDAWKRMIDAALA